MLGEFVFERHKPEMVLSTGTEPDDEELTSVIVQNTAPWTFLGGRAIHPSSEASFDKGLDVLGLRGLGLPSTVRTMTQLLSIDGDPHGKQVVRHHDLADFTVTSAAPQAFQLDGDYLGEREKVRFAAVPRALRVIC
jgi:diacylglycerol kinase family enzyme